MFKIDPQQELFIALKLGIEALGHTVHDTVMPGEKEPYPFDFLGDNEQTDRTTKSAVMGSVHQTIHTWHNNTRQRGTVSDRLREIKGVCYNLERTTNYSWSAENITQRIFADTTTATPLLHGVIEVDFNFTLVRS